jgi:hypothetical protein
MEKRLGKTFCACQWAKFHSAARVLVVAPLSAIPGWLDEIEADKEDIAWDLTNHTNLKQWVEAEGDLPGRFFITNPQALFRPSRGNDLGPSPRETALYPWSAVIWDELTTIYNAQSQINKVARLCLGDIPLRLGLSGEYAPETPLNIFEQMRWVFGSFMGFQNFWKWRNANFQELYYDWIPKPGRKIEIRRVIEERCFILSRKSAGVVNEIAFEKRCCKLPTEIQRVYDHAEVYFEIPPNRRHGLARTTFTAYVPVLRNWLVQIAGGYPKCFEHLYSDHKLKLLWEIIQEHHTEQLVVSFRHNLEIAHAAEFLKKKRITATIIQGGIDVPERRKRCSAFAAGRFQVILKQAKVHFGMNLAAADTMIRYSISDEYKDVSQDMDRIIHPEKKRPLLYIDLVTVNTVDEDLHAAATIDKPLQARYWMQKIQTLGLLRAKCKLLKEQQCI